MEWDLCFIPLHFIPLHYVPFRSAPLSSINPNITKNKMNLPSFTSKSLVSTSHNFVYVPECKFASQMILILSRVSTSSIPFWLLILSLSRVLRQFHFDSHSLSCSTWSVEFTLGNVEDEKSHAQFHKGFTQGIQFRVTNQLPL
jgi:hypothetical protein